MIRTGLLLLLLSLTACWTDPTPTTLTLTASSGLNPNSDGQPSPTVVRIYELKSVDTFNKLSFFELFDSDAAKLGGDLLNRREIELQPGKETELKRDAETGAQFIGVIAGYRSVKEVTWRASAPLTAEKTNTIIVRLDPLSLTLTKRPRRFLWIF